MTVHLMRIMRIFAGLLAGLGFFSQALEAGGSRFAGDPLQKPVALPDVSYKRLLNDLQVVIASTPHLGEDMTIGLVSRYGSVFDPVDKGGLAHLVSRLLLNATQDKTANDIKGEMNDVGARIEIRADWDGIRCILRGQSSRFERALLLLYQVIGEAVFTEADFARVKGEILQEIEKVEDPRQQIHSRFETALFRGTTYGRPLQGTKASVQNISLGDVRLFYRRYFSPNASSLVVAGSAPAALVQQKATRIWGVWVRRDEVPFTFLPPRNPASKTVVLENEPASAAAQFILGNLWPRREDPSFVAAGLAARILQERLTKALPTSLLTVGSEGRRMSGPFYIQGQAAAEQAVSEITKVLETAETFKTGPLSSDELSASQKRWIEEFNKSLLATDTLCNLLLDAELYRLGTNYMASFSDMVKRQTPEMVKEAARELIFPSGVLIYVRGPAGALKPGLELLGSVQNAS